MRDKLPPVLYFVFVSLSAASAVNPLIRDDDNTNIALS